MELSSSQDRLFKTIRSDTCMFECGHKMLVTFGILVNFHTPVDVKLGGQSEKCYSRVCPVCHSWNDTSREVVWCCRDDTAPASASVKMCIYTFGTNALKGNPTHFCLFAFYFRAAQTMRGDSFMWWTSSTFRGSHCYISSENILDGFWNSEDASNSLTHGLIQYNTRSISSVVLLTV